MRRLAGPLMYLGLFGMQIEMMALAPVTAVAALGGFESSIEDDTQMLAGTRTRASALSGRYEIHEIQSDGMIVREYVSKSGRVFGVSWRGRTQPDLTRLFGNYYDDFSQASLRRAGSNAAAGPSRRLRGQVKPILGAKIVVEKSGHLRAQRGRAYVPALLPSGVKADEVR